MAIDRAIQILFLIGAIFFECYLVFAASLYVPWKSASFLLVVVAGTISIFVITYYILTFERRAGEYLKEKGTAE